MIQYKNQNLELNQELNQEYHEYQGQQYYMKNQYQERNENNHIQLFFLKENIFHQIL